MASGFSTSEGEIVEAAGHKAMPSSRHPQNRAVDRSIRLGLNSPVSPDTRYTGKSRRGRERSRSPEPYRRRVSKSPSPYRASRYRSPSPYRHGRRNKSRSPFRHGRAKSRSPFRHPRNASRSPYRHNRDRSRSPFRHPRSPRGEKRRRSRDDYAAHDNPRARTQRSTVSYADVDRPESPPLRRSGHDGAAYGRRGAGNGFTRPGYGDASRVPPFSRAGIGHTADMSRLGSGRSNIAFHPAKDDNKTHWMKHQARNVASAGAHGFNGNAGDLVGAKGADKATAEEPELDCTVPEVEDDASIEAIRAEKRKKREAIRAKAAAEAAAEAAAQKPLLEQATENAADKAPGAANAADASAVGSPAQQTGNSSSTSVEAPDTDGDSPAALVVGGEKEEQDKSAYKPLTDHEMSAANYDPAKDGEQDRIRAVLKIGQPASATETNQEDPASAEKPPVKKRKKDFDMFNFDTDSADDDDSSDELPKGKVLDQSLLDNWDDKHGFYRILAGELYCNRYLARQTLGQGTFANVVRAYDNSAHKMVAIKIVRKNEMMRSAANKEIGFLKRLMEADPDDKKHIVRFLSQFDHKQHLCMVFENLDMNLRDLMQRSASNRGFSLQAVRVYARQLLTALVLLETNHVVHADIKPDNILASEDHKIVKLADLGSAADSRDPIDVGTYLVSRYYRAPEIILGMKITPAIDVWSLACTLFELFTGKVLFPGTSNNQMLRCFMECRGKLSYKFLKKGTQWPYHFNGSSDADLSFRSAETNQYTGGPCIRTITFMRPVKDLKTRIGEAAQGTKDETDAYEMKQFVDLLDKCLAYYVERRIKAADALRHPFFLPKPAPAPVARRPGPPRLGPTRR